MKKLSTKDMTLVAVFAAIIAVVSLLPGIPLPGGVPMTLQTLIIPVAGIVLGPELGFLATLIYVLLGAVGLPVFTGMTGGLGIILGTTGGFIVTFPILALTAGFGDRLGRSGKWLPHAEERTIAHESGTHIHKAKYYVFMLLLLLAGNVINYLVGTAWCMVVAGVDWWTAFGWCTLPFIPTSLLKMVLIVLIAPVLRRALVRAGVLTPQVQG